MRTRLLLSLIFALALAAAAFAVAMENPLLVPFGEAGRYVYAAPAEKNYTFATNSSIYRSDLEGALPRELSANTLSIIGPLRLEPRTYLNERVVTRRIYLEHNAPNLPYYTLRSDCQYMGYIPPDEVPQPGKGYIPPVACHAPQLQVYLNNGSLDMARLEAYGQVRGDYWKDGLYYYFKTRLDEGSTVAVAYTAGRGFIEFDNANPSSWVAQLLWLSHTGLVANVSDDDILFAGAEIGRSMERDMDDAATVNAGSISVRYSPLSATKNVQGYPQSGRYIAFWGLSPVDLPPSDETLVRTPAPAPAPAPTREDGPNVTVKPSLEVDVREAQVVREGGEEGLNASDNATAGTAADAAMTQIAQMPAPPPAPGPGAEGASAKQAAPLLDAGRTASPTPAPPAEGWPWWMGPLIVGSLGALLAAVLALNFKPRPTQAAGTVGVQQMLYLSETRQAIIDDLVVAERIPTDLALRLGKSKSTIVEHLDGLCEAGLVERVAEPGHKFVFYRLTRSGRQYALSKKAGQAQ